MPKTLEREKPKRSRARRHRTDEERRVIRRLAEILAHRIRRAWEVDNQFEFNFDGP